MRSLSDVAWTLSFSHRETSDSTRPDKASSVSSRCPILASLSDNFLGKIQFVIHCELCLQAKVIADILFEFHGVTPGRG